MDLAIVFVGQRIVELRAADHLGSYHQPVVPQVAWLSTAPTLQGVAIASAMALLPLTAWSWVKLRPACPAASRRA